MKNFFENKISHRILWALGVVIVVALIFQAGVYVGFRKASFAFRFGDNFYRAFDGPKRGPAGMMEFDRGLPGRHGVVGKVVKVEDSTLVISGQDNIEHTVRINKGTVIKRFRGNASTTDLLTDSYVMVLGKPNDQSEIEAKLIRLVPAPNSPRANYFNR